MTPPSLVDCPERGHVAIVCDEREQLARYFVEKFAARIGRRIESIAPDTLERLRAYPRPGNVRELENVIERAVILSPGPALETEALALRARNALPAPDAAAQADGDGRRSKTCSAAASRRRSSKLAG